MKLLWVKQAVPDTYVHPTFLSQLKHNQNVVPYQYNTVTFDASTLLVNIDVGIIFILSFVAIYLRNIDPRLFVAMASAADLILVLRCMRRVSWCARASMVKSSLIMVVTILCLTPVFRSLTESTSSDSIWALCGWLLLANVMVSSRSIPALSTNTALAATIVLASRLETSLDVFYFVLFSTQSFVALPSAYKWLKMTEVSYAWCYSFVFLISLGSCCLVLFVLGWPLMVLWALFQLLILFGLPMLFLSLQKHKDRISGPWDPAKPDLN